MLLLKLGLRTPMLAAVAHDQLRLFHQPIADLRDERVIGHEALVRWEHRRPDLRGRTDHGPQAAGHHPCGHGHGHALGLEIVAEGVETPDQAAQLRDLGCTRAQVFLYGRPEPLDLTQY